MRKYFLITSIFFIYLFPAFSQNANTIWIDSLKKQLSSQHDSAKVDVLNELADAFRTMGPYPAWDSIYKYAIAANEEALKIGYKKGEAFSLLNLPNRETKDAFYDEAHIEQAISIGESIKEPKILGKSYLYLSYCLKKEHRIEVLKKALAYCEQANDSEGEMEANELLCDDYTSNGKYEEGFKYCDKCAKLIKQATLTPWGDEWALWYFLHMAQLYQRAEDYETSLEYFRQGNQYAQKYHVSWNLDLNMINAFTQLGQYDSAFYYWKKFENNASPYVLNHRVYWSSILGEIYLKTKQYDKALDIAKEGIAFFKKQKSTGFGLTGHLLSAAKVYTEMKNYKTALQYAKEGLILAKKNDMLASIISGDQLLANIYHQLGNNTNAYNYLSQYHALKDSIQSRQFLLRMYNLKKEAEEERRTGQINLLNKDNQLKEQKLKQQAIVRNSLVGGIILLFLLALFVFRNLSLRRKNERADLQRRATELEAQALRAQMNPHFIFNCLSSINKFILKNDTDAASDYLTRFSRLIRFVLTNSQLSLIPLSDEIEMLRLYLDMERLRFSDSFDYNIIYANTIEPETVYLPPMLLQPFCENAIWHGMMPKDGQGKLEVTMSIRDHQLECVITDNGIGRKKAAELKTNAGANQKSFGLKITTERLALFNNEKFFENFYRTEDILDVDGNVAGTKVILIVRYKNNLTDTSDILLSEQRSALRGS